MEYWKRVTIPSYLCDIDDFLHPWATIRLFQEVSEQHTNDLHIGFEDLLKTNRAWVLSRAYYEFRQRPKAFQTVDIGTWSRGNNGLFAYRDYEMRTLEGEVIICGTSYWPIIDMQSRSVVRLHDILEPFPPVEREATAHSNLGRLKSFDIATREPDYQVDVQYSMLDHTRHVNNAEYNKWMFDYVASRGTSFHQPFSIEVNYQAETRPGDTCRLYCNCDKQFTVQSQTATQPESLKAEPTTYWLQIFNSRGLGVSACVKAGL